MITSEQEFQGTKDRMDYFERLLVQLRTKATPEEFNTMASGYRAELERMQAEVVCYLTRPLEELAEAA